MMETFPWLLEDKKGTILRLRVQPRSSRSGPAGPVGDRLKFAVHAAPEGGSANEEVLRVLAKTLGVPKTDLEIVRGATHREKDILLPSHLSFPAIIAHLTGKEK